MTDKVQLIKQEIERRILQCYKCLAQDLLEREISETKTCLQQYKELLQFIDSLPEESESENLEEIAINAWNKYSGLELMHIEEVVAFFREAAEWQKQQMMKDAVDAIIFSELKGSDGSLFQVKSDRFRMNDVKINDKIKVIPIKN